MRCSIFEGLLALGHEHSESPLLAYLVLAAAGLTEGTSLALVLTQYRSEARRTHTEVLDQVQSSPDMTIRTALFEDSAAMVGLALAALGLTMRQVTGSPAEDVADEIDKRLADRLPVMPHVFLDPTQASPGLGTSR